MKSGQFNKQMLINYWISGSDDDFDTMISMFEAKRYNWSLFVGHLMIEKLLKAYFVQEKEVNNLEIIREWIKKQIK